MNTLLLVGIILSLGFVLGWIFERFRLPKILGYLIAGVVLNPQLCHFVPADITVKTNILENIAIAFIAFSIGGTIVYSKIKKLGKGIVFITLAEAEVTFLAITGGFLLILPFVPYIPKGAMLTMIVPISLLLGCIGSPTDPTATLAVTHEYKATGEVSSTMLSVSAFDDVLGIINYSVAIVIAQTIVSRQAFSAYNAFLVPLLTIVGSVILGTALGMLFNFITIRMKKETEGAFSVLIFSFLTLCWGLATLVHAEEILSIMIMGIVVTNFNQKPEKIFKMMERYSEELVFLIFFVLSGMHLDFTVTPIAVILLVFFIIFRLIGKFAGTALGAKIAHSSPKIKRYTAPGLIPYGGIVIGLALLMHQNPAFSKFSNLLVSTIVGATIINEFIGPICVEKSLKKAGEI